jgi:hypothetical protein
LASVRDLSLWIPLPRQHYDHEPEFDPSPLSALFGRLTALKLRFEMRPKIARAFRPLLRGATSLETLTLVDWPKGIAPPALAGLTALVGGTRTRRRLGGSFARASADAYASVAWACRLRKPRNRMRVAGPAAAAP